MSSTTVQENDASTGKMAQLFPVKNNVQEEKLSFGCHVVEMCFQSSGLNRKVASKGSINK